MKMGMIAVIFNEIYGCYYNTVAKILKQAVQGNLTEDKMNKIVCENAFAESVLTIIPALREQKWQLLKDDFTTPLKHTPSMPLTNLQKRWLKAISLDPRIKLFGVTDKGLKDVEPLFTADDYVVFDKYGDGDPYDDEHYIETFHTVLRAINEGRKINVSYTTRRGIPMNKILIPQGIEYSEKDDKFRLIVYSKRECGVINIARIEKCMLLEKHDCKFKNQFVLHDNYVVLELIDERNALERVMMHFAHFEKQAERIDSRKYRLKIKYSPMDVTELVIRVLSFGPLVKVVEPDHFKNLIKERLIRQKSCELDRN